MDTPRCPISKHDDNSSSRVEVVEEEVLLGTLMGRKRKEGFTHLQLGESMSVAGRYNKDVGGMQPTRLGRHDGRSNVDTAPPRHDMHMIMSPRDNDPPPPTQITPCKKYAGPCRVPS